MTKRIILLLDGTWNDADFGAEDTNIVRLREIIARTLWSENDAKPSKTALDQTEPTVRPKNYANLNNIVFYERGVGSGAFLNRFSEEPLVKG